MVGTDANRRVGPLWIKKIGRALDAVHRLISAALSATFGDILVAAC